MNFDFMSPSRILVQTKGLVTLGELAKPFGSHALLVTRTKATYNDVAHRALEQAHIKVTRIFSKGEPTIDSLSQSLSIARKNNIDFVVALGGGSIIDTGKMLAALMQNPGDILDYVEVIGEGKPLSVPSLPFIAIPTTSGTGAEATKNGVLSFPSLQAKVSLRSPTMLADLVLIDASLTLSVPKNVTAYTGMDALTQLLEPYVSNQANPITDAFSKEGLVRIARSFKRAYDNLDDIKAREDMALASLFGGLALANAKLGAVHGLAGPLGGMYPIPHGVACAALLPHVVKANINALTKSNPAHPTLERFKDIAILLTNNFQATPNDLILWLTDLCAYMQLPTLKEFKIKKEHAPQIIEKANNSSSMKGNPIKLSDKELKIILRNAL